VSYCSLGKGNCCGGSCCSVGKGKSSGLSYCSVGKGKCCGASVIIFTYVSIEMLVMRSTGFCLGNY
jgi:hypothetical protein